jgi:hypothetical protein
MQETIDAAFEPREGSIVPSKDSPIVEADAAMAGYEFVRDLTLAEGQGVSGAIYLGKGEPAAIADPATGEVREVPTVLLKVRNVTYRMLASAMLERLLGAVKVGSVVAICNRGLVETRRGRRMTAWDVGVRK